MELIEDMRLLWLLETSWWASKTWCIEELRWLDVGVRYEALWGDRVTTMMLMLWWYTWVWVEPRLNYLLHTRADLIRDHGQYMGRWGKCILVSIEAWGWHIADDGEDFMDLDGAHQELMRWSLHFGGDIHMDNMLQMTVVLHMLQWCLSYVEESTS